VFHGNAVFGKKMRARADQCSLKAKNRIASASVIALHPLRQHAALHHRGIEFFELFSVQDRQDLDFLFFGRIFARGRKLCPGSFAFLLFGGGGGFVFLFARHEREPFYRMRTLGLLRGFSYGSSANFLPLIPAAFQQISEKECGKTL
jgi:hypothetical protein